MPTTQDQEEQLRELKRRCEAMEAERQAAFEATHRTLRANQVTLLQLKETQADLLQQLKETKKEKVLSEPQHIERKNEEVARLRAQLDRHRNQNAAHRQRLRQLRDKLRELELASAKPCTEDSPEIRSMRAIESRLDQALIALNEANAVKTTYEQIANRLKNERIGMHKHLEALEANFKEKKQEHENLLGVCHDATHANELAQAELHRVRKTLEAEREKRGAEVREKQLVIRQWLQNEKRQREAASQEAAARAAAAGAAAGVVLPEETVGDSAEAESYEEALRRLKEATGVSDANEIIEHFLTQNQTYEQLLALAQGHQVKLQQLQEQKRRYSQLLEERKFAEISSGIVAGGGDSPEAAEAKCAAAKLLLQRQQQAFDRTQVLLSELRTGISSLILKLTSANEKFLWVAPPAPGASLAETFHFCCEVTKELMKAVSTLPQKAPAAAETPAWEEMQEQQQIEIDGEKAAQPELTTNDEIREAAAGETPAPTAQETPAAAEETPAEAAEETPAAATEETPAAATEETPAAAEEAATAAEATAAAAESDAAIAVDGETDSPPDAAATLQETAD